ncbi:molybdate ABC transporter permease subunit [Paenibacillus sp. FSL W7-1287]|uniref:molybdate ABC transporter permease subunit n=1 Tax=Paenibacillus sp. FSL W7-1287 TaxID=2954538 RepID=UPI0030F6040F
MSEVFSWQSFITPVIVSLKITLLASVIVFVLALVAARWMSRSSFRGKLWIDVLFMLPLVLPPTVVGFILLYAFGKQGFAGRLLYEVFDFSVVFTWWGGVISAVVVAFPLVYQTIKAGFDGIDRDLEDVARSQGANEWQVLRYISMPLIYRMLLVGYMLGFARALGEFGATLMLAGNIPGRTQTIATAIYIAADSGKTSLALGWVIVMILISILLLLIVRQPAKD